MEQVKKLTTKINMQEEKIEYLTDRAMGQRMVIERLQEQAADLGAVEAIFRRRACTVYSRTE